MTPVQRWLARVSLSDRLIYVPNRFLKRVVMPYGVKFVFTSVAPDGILVQAGGRA